MATPEDSSLIRCSICFNSKEGRQPRGLSCFHSFCQECLKEWHERRHRDGHCSRTQVECPTCRTISALPSGDITRLPMDINVQQIADYFNKESKLSCHVCSIKNGESACMMCHVLLCEDCSEKHNQTPMFASHVLSRNICELHGAALQGVCATCFCGVCLKCVAEGLHKDHQLEELSSGIKEIKSQVTKYTGELKELLRTGNLEIQEKRNYIRQFQCVEDMKRSLDVIKKEVERLEKEIAEHERLCEANIDAMFKEYEAHSKRASAAILDGNQLLAEDDENILDKLQSANLPNEDMCNLHRSLLSSVPDFNSITFTKCRLDNSGNTLKALKSCKVVGGLPGEDPVPYPPAPPVQVLQLDCGTESDIKNPWRLCGTPEGDVIVCDCYGGPVYKVYKDGTKTQLHDDGRAACVHGGDIYVISTDGSTVTKINKDGSTLKHKLDPPILNVMRLFMSDDHAYVLSYNVITKQSLVDPHCRETFNIPSSQGMMGLLRIRHNGMTKLVIIDHRTHEVIICDETGAVLTRFGGSGSQGGSLDSPRGLSRMSNGNLMVADWQNHRIVEYDMSGTFVRNLLTKKDRLWNPADVVYKYPYLWVVENNCMLKSNIKLFKF